jgi:hypothetical protein
MKVLPLTASHRETRTMLDAEALRGLLDAYIDGDVTAKKVLLDFLDDAGDPRAEAVRAEAIDWDVVAWELTPGKRGKRPPPRQRWNDSRDPAAFNARIRWLIDCARVGDSVRPEVTRAVAEARRDWLKELFPEAQL